MSESFKKGAWVVTTEMSQALLDEITKTFKESQKFFSGEWNSRCVVIAKKCEIKVETKFIYQGKLWEEVLSTPWKQYVSDTKPAFTPWWQYGSFQFKGNEGRFVPFESPETKQYLPFQQAANEYAQYDEWLQARAAYFTWARQQQEDTEKMKNHKIGPESREKRDAGKRDYLKCPKGGRTNFRR